MKKIMKTAAMAAFAFGMAQSASAAITVDTSVPAGGFQDLNVICAVGATAPCAFSESATFVTPAGFNVVSATISTVLSGAGTNIDFSSVMLNGVSFGLTPTGVVEFGQLLGQSLVAGATNTLSVSGTTAGNASFSGVLAFGSVPEPATWLMMMLGFAGIGFVMRRKQAGAGETRVSFSNGFATA